MTSSAVPDPVVAVSDILSWPDEQLDYARAKLALDTLVDPAVHTDWAMAELDRLTRAARDLVGSRSDGAAKLNAIRRVIYEVGSWNDHRLFAYNHEHPLGTHIPDKLLANFLRTRRGNCVSMPILFLILADRLGLSVALAAAPEHIFVRYHDETGHVFNLETTSGAFPARSEWMRQNFPMSDRALESGIYMRSLSRREAVAAMASTVFEHLAVNKRHAEVVGVATEVLRHSPHDIHAMVFLASACGYVIQTEFQAKYPAPFLIPWHLRQRYLNLSKRNLAMFAAAEALGWEPTEEAFPAAPEIRKDSLTCL